jgi:ketosteroid isomerase-like protein
VTGSSLSGAGGEEKREVAGVGVSQENVEVVRTAVDAVNRADVEAFVGCFHPDVEWEVSGEGFPGFDGTYRGHEGVRRWLEQALELWESVHLDVEEITEPSHNRLVVGVLMTTRGGGSGVETQLRLWQVFLVADGQVRKRTGPYWTRTAALEAAGPRDQRAR